MKYENFWNYMCKLPSIYKNIIITMLKYMFLDFGIPYTIALLNMSTHYQATII